MDDSFDLRSSRSKGFFGQGMTHHKMDQLPYPHAGGARLVFDGSRADLSNAAAELDFILRVRYRVICAIPFLAQDFGQGAVDTLSGRGLSAEMGDGRDVGTASLTAESEAEQGQDRAGFYFLRGGY